MVKQRGTLKKESAQKKPPKVREQKLWLSPSKWGVWRKCALSVCPMPIELPVESDGYAQEGTDLHTVIAARLNGDNSIIIYDEDEPMIRFAVDTTLAYVGGTHVSKIHVEHFAKAKFGNITIGGTADCLINASGNGDTIISIDHKTGWKEVEAEGNEQLKIYAHLAAKENKNLKQWQGVIINARFNSTSYTGGAIEKNYLKSIADDVRARYAKKQFKTGHHCAYCARLTTCKHIRKAILDWMVPGAIDGLTRDPIKLGEALRLKKPADKLFETIQKEAQLYIDLGGKIPGVSIEYSPGNRVFPNDMTAMQIAGKIGLPGIQLIEEKLVTPTEALRRGADKDAVNALVIRPPRKVFKFN